MRIIRTAFWTSAALIGLALIVTTPAAADQQILDDLIVDGSACVGQDCVNGESFGFDTIRIKENNLRIKAQDTSSTASFPTFDWQLTFNDSSNGGQNKFAVECIDGGTTPFTVEGCAPSHSLYVDSSGDVGFGTNAPVVDLHVKSGNTPTLRLEQDGTSGFTAQIWDVAGNEANFFIRDVTNGSDLPFRIFPNAGTNALVIEGGTGDIGMGTTNPKQPLHVFSAADQDAIVGLGVSPDFPGSDAFLFGYNGTNATPQGFIGTRSGTTQITVAVENDSKIKLDQNGLVVVDSCIEFNDGAIACTAAAGSFTCVAGSC